MASPGRGARRQRAHDTAGVSAPVPTISAVTVVLSPGATDGGSALIASTRGLTINVRGGSSSGLQAAPTRRPQQQQERSSLACHQKSPRTPQIGSSGKPASGRLEVKSKLKLTASALVARVAFCTSR